MVDKKTSEETAAATLDGTELVRGVQSGANVKMTTQAIAALTAQIVDITTGASQVDIDLADYAGWIALVFRVTSGGTASVETMNFIGPDSDLRDTSVGRTINVIFVAQTDPSDVINITQNGGGVVSCIDSIGNAIGAFSTGIMDEVGNNIVFGFNGDVIRQYAWNCLYGAWDSPTIITQKRNPMPQGGSFGALPYADGDGDAAWSAGPIAPFPVFNAGAVAALNSGYPAGTYPRGMATVYDANLPVVGSVVAGSGSSACVVISNGTDYIVMFIFP